MIFEQETVAFQILDVLYLDQKMIKTYNYNRNFDAISFRFEADTVIETEKTQLELTDNNICFFPADINYTRDAKKDKMIVVNFKCFGYLINCGKILGRIKIWKETSELSACLRVVAMHRV